MQILSRTSLTSLLVCLLAIAVAGSAHATDVGPLGGPGGGPFRVTCQSGSYIAGFSGRVGDWIDQLSMQCAPWNPQSRHLEPPSTTVRPIGESHGGAPSSAYCPGGTAIAGLLVLLLQSDAALVSNLTAECRALDAGATDAAFDFGGHGQFPSNELVGWQHVVCPENEVAVGLFGRSGLFIDAVGLICGPPPPPVGTATPRTLPGGRAPAAIALSRPSRWAAPTTQRNAVAQRLGVTAQSTAPPPFDVPEGPTPGLATAQGVRHNYPFINDYGMAWGLLDWCSQYGTNCGAPAAKAYCSAVDGGQHPRLVDFHKFEAAGRYRTTITIVSRAQCNAPTCSAFTYVTCGN